MIFTMLDKLSAREKIGFSIAGLFMFVLLMDCLILRPVLGKLGVFYAKIETESGRLEYNFRIKQMEPGVTREYDEISGLIGSSLSSDETINEMKGEIDELAKLTGVELTSIDHREPQKVPFCEKVCEEYAVEIGRFETEIGKLLAFLYKIENEPGLLQIVKLNVTPAKTQGAVAGSMLITKIVKTGDIGSIESSAEKDEK